VVSFAIPPDVETPAVLVDVTRLEHNITTWAARMAARGVGLRPHTKTSTCAQVIRRQVEAGAIGLTVATLGEAEALADAGFDHLFQAYPLWAGTPHRARRLRELHERADLMVGVESVEGAAALGRAVAGASRPLGVLVELDSGLRRTGVSETELLAVVHACLDAGLDVRGAFTFGGHGYASCAASPRAGDDEVDALAHAADVMRDAGVDVRVLSAGSTPTALHSARPPVTDERPGTYVFHDRHQLALGTASLDEVALVVAATVVSSHGDGRFVLDAGSKVLSSDRLGWLEGYGLLLDVPEAEIRSLSEHHAVAWTSGPRPPVGARVAVVPNHCCVVVNLADELLAVADGAVVERWPLLSRGKNA
jgi:D-serine deaminase-like pyridoxal phosphate-dependent protein